MFDSKLILIACFQRVCWQNSQCVCHSHRFRHIFSSVCQSTAGFSHVFNKSATSIEQVLIISSRSSFFFLTHAAFHAPISSESGFLLRSNVTVRVYQRLFQVGECFFYFLRDYWGKFGQRLSKASVVLFVCSFCVCFGLWLWLTGTLFSEFGLVFTLFTSSCSARHLRQLAGGSPLQLAHIAESSRSLVKVGVWCSKSHFMHMVCRWHCLGADILVLLTLGGNDPLHFCADSYVEHIGDDAYVLTFVGSQQFH